jgi:protein Shroom
MTKKIYENRYFHSRNQKLSCDMVKLRKASFRLIEEISTEKNSEKLRVLNIMKENLIERLCRKVKILKEEKDELDNDDVENEKEGMRIVGVLKQIGTLSEVDKLEVHMRESGSITNLLLFLRSKLETTESMLQTGADNVDKVGTENITQHRESCFLQEKLEKKQKKLSAQLSEALKLKEFRDRKGVSIEKMLENYLDIGEQN